ncbi:unnamed protein product [Debaryomyces fabryi]|nr:unnamed protein product [Debaryomyces fabryi]
MSFSVPNSVKVSYDDDEIPILSYDNDRPISANVRSDMSKKEYENNTYIDWNRESMVEPKSSALIYRKWTTIIVLSIILGYVTTFIDLASVWLNDVKKGLCYGEIDKWSLSNPYLTCPADDWYDWSQILVGSQGIISNILINFPIYLVFAGCWIAVAAYITINRDIFIKQSGIPEIKLIISGFNYDLPVYLGLHTLIYKIFGLILVVSSGLWLGKEGPLVHVSCCILNILYGAIVNKESQNEAVRRELLSAATATGISVAFNAPIGGVLFVLESTPSFFMPTKVMWNSFLSATTAVVVLTGFKLFTEGENFYEKDLFKVNFGNFSWLFVELIPFVILGVLGALYGYIFIKFNAKFSSKHFRGKVQGKLCQILNLSDSWGKYLEIFAIVVLTTILNFPFEMTKLPLHAYLKILFTDCPDDSNIDLDSNSSNFMCLPSNGITSLKLLYIIVQGFFLTSYTYGVNLPGGVLMPSLVLGATTGRLLGIISQALQNQFSWESLATCTQNSCLVSPSSYAVIGAASFVAGITKLTMCVVVIMFELTGAITYVLPIMCSVMVLKFVNDWLCNDNIYDSWLKNHFNRYESHKGEPNEGKGNGLCDFTNLTATVKNRLPDVTIAKAMVPIHKTKYISLIPEEPYTIKSLYQFMNDDNHEGYPIIVNDSNPISLGYVYKTNIASKLSTIDSELDNSVISFQIQGLPNHILSQQLHYERSFESTNIIRLDINTENSVIITNDQTPLVLVLEMFEKLSLNYLIIMNHNPHVDQLMSGFIDRFIISRLINLHFRKLQGEDADSDSMQDFDIENTLEDEHLLTTRLDRMSVELIT